VTSLHVVVAVVTFRRPADLAELLPLLADQRIEPTDEGARIDLLVVDNDPGRSAEPVVRSAGVASRYVVEPHPGIGAARDRALAEAAGADLLVFIDDDERPAPGWLAALVRMWRRSGAAAVAGSVQSRLPVDPDPWIVAGQLFTRRHRAGLPSGADLPSAATNNLLLDLAAVGRLGLRFDSAFGISGGEDELFTRRLVAGGERIVWCPEAVVHEEVRPDRVNRRWLMLRTLSYGAVDARIALALAGRSRLRRGWTRLQCAGSGLARIGVGALRWSLGRARRSLRDDSFGLQTLVRGCGLVAGAAGVDVNRYRRPAPAPARPATQAEAA
jgi:glycosyltransferase involved in cell wall biosynthesis